MLYYVSLSNLACSVRCMVFYAKCNVLCETRVDRIEALFGGSF